MSTSEQERDTPEIQSVRVERFQRHLDEILKPENLAEILYRDRKLSRREIDAKVIELGYNAALRVLAAQACTGDTRALDLFLKRCDLYHSSRRTNDANTEDTPAPYSRPQRTTDAGSSDPSAGE